MAEAAVEVPSASAWLLEATCEEALEICCVLS
jgi:hypothetical protein